MSASSFRIFRPHVTRLWFNGHVSPWRAFGLTDYLCSADTGRHAGYLTTLQYTKVIDLAQDERAILAGFSARTRNYVLRAAREGITFRESDDVDGFVVFFNRFADARGLDYRVSREELQRTGANWRILQALHGDDVLAMHLIVCDEARQRARCLYLASILHDQHRRVSDLLVGIANKAAHYHGMCLFKRLGFSQYDLGGYALGTNDPELERINRFKDCFGGTLLREAHHRSLPLHLALSLVRYLRGRKRPQRSTGPLAVAAVQEGKR